MSRHLTLLIVFSLMLAAIFFGETQGCPRTGGRGGGSRRSSGCGTYDPRHYTCCRGTLHLGGGQSCCGSRAYSLHHRTCCRGILHFGSGRSCCGSKAYDYSFSRCCNGRVVFGLHC
ncbi:hypothetical protein NP493_142g03005 [Ridgeia piscesae]|uniref:Galaxin-like repeats domain-containing protein n=1 Tax=Ridgeia piscesae TaxID=27915 RepID=A0AAD9UG75_RIDPI|nr:hypothetical protein NP493_142g03005 [Ridgeia piscesae]